MKVIISYLFKYIALLNKNYSKIIENIEVAMKGFCTQISSFEENLGFGLILKSPAINASNLLTEQSSIGIKPRENYPTEKNACWSWTGQDQKLSPPLTLKF